MRTPVRGWAAAVLTLGVALYAGNLVRHRAQQWDDAFITARYAVHLANGDGLVWNVGGERVEGYTSPLHLLMLAAVARVGVTPERVAVPLGTACTIGAAMLFGWMAWRRSRTISLVAALTIALFLADDSTAIHSTSGLETPLFVLALATLSAVALRVIEAPRRGGTMALAACLVLACLARPEGLLLGLVLTVAIAFRRAAGEDAQVRASARAASRAALGAAIVLGVYVAWKYSYFGYLLPNPYYVKSNRLSLAGLTEVWHFVRHELWRFGPIAAALVVVAGAGAAMAALRERAATYAVFLLPALGLCYYVTIVHEVGGAYRFTFPLVTFPIVAVILWDADCVERSQERPLHSSVVAIAGIVLMLVLTRSFDFRPEPRGGFSDYHWRIATALRDTGLGANATVLCDAAGIIPYVSLFNHIDRVGLNDNFLSGRHPVPPAERERYLWSRGADVYIGYEPPASSGAESASSDPLFRSPYVSEVLLRRSDPLADRMFALDPALLHARMRELRDRWQWVGEMEFPGRQLWGLRSFVYVHNGADRHLNAALDAIVAQRPPAISLADNGPAETR